MGICLHVDQLKLWVVSFAVWKHGWILKKTKQKNEPQQASLQNLFSSASAERDIAVPSEREAGRGRL